MPFLKIPPKGRVNISPLFTEKFVGEDETERVQGIFVHKQTLVDKQQEDFDALFLILAQNNFHVSLVSCEGANMICFVYWEFWDFIIMETLYEVLRPRGWSVFVEPPQSRWKL
jgi:hypothetical protein